MTQTPPLQPQPPRLPMGQPNQWSDDDLDALSQVSEADLLHAVAMWKRDIPVPSLRSLLDAESDTNRGVSSSGRF